jgi:hypothetical protein
MQIGAAILHQFYVYPTVHSMICAVHEELSQSLSYAESLEQIPQNWNLNTYLSRKVLCYSADTNPYPSESLTRK